MIRRVAKEEGVAKEAALLEHAAPAWEDLPRGQDRQTPLFLSDDERAAATSDVPFAPGIVSRTNKTITVLPRRWFPKPARKKGKKNGYGGGGSRSTAAAGGS